MLGPNIRKPVPLECVDYAVHQRLLRADDGEADSFFLGEANQLVEFVDADGYVRAVCRGARIAGCTEDCFDSRGLGELPNECVLASAFTDDQNFHDLPTTP